LENKQDGVLDKDKAMDNAQKRNICSNCFPKQKYGSILTEMCVLLLSGVDIVTCCLQGRIT
jgi:predicted SPOUT superfamily RNA methylase MTH1